MQPEEMYRVSKPHGHNVAVRSTLSSQLNGSVPKPTSTQRFIENSAEEEIDDKPNNFEPSSGRSLDAKLVPPPPELVAESAEP